MGHSCAGCCLWHDIASWGGGELPMGGYSGCAKPTGGTDLVRYCRHCFGVGQRCWCSAIPHQAPGPTSALWTPPMVSYTAMVSSTETTASTSATGVTRPSYPPLGMPPLEAMDTLSAPTTENLLATAGVGRGGRTWTQLRTPTAPGIHQTRPRAPQQQAPTPRRQEVTQVTPYRQQVYPPWCTTPNPSTAPSTSQGHEELAREDEGARGRSSSQGPQNRQRRNRSSTRGSRKRQRGIQNSDLMDEMSNYVASGWKRDLTYVIGCCWAAQVGPLDREEWQVAIRKFLAVMVKWMASEWTDIKELTPLQFMPYVANLFRKVTGKDLQGLSQFTGWIGLGGYYHWRVAQQGLLHAVPRLQGWPVPRVPIARPSGQPLPPKPTQIETPAAGASERQQDRAQPTPDGGGTGSTSNQGGKPSTSSQSGKSSTPSQGGKSSASGPGGKTPTPRQSSKPASTNGGEKPATLGGSVDPPLGREGADDGTWADWYQRTMLRAEDGISEPQGSPYPIGMAQVRWEAIDQIYDCVDGKDPPSRNIASEALRAYYSGVNPLTLKT